MSRAIGRVMEDRALKFLRGEGLVLIERNFQCRFGEIDLIMRDGDCLVFVEVRYRHSARQGSALESVGPTKQRRLVRSAQSFLQQRRTGATEQRIDVIALDDRSGSRRGRDPHLQWVRNAVEATSA